MRSWLRLLPVLGLLACTGIFLNARNRPERLRPHSPFSSFPLELGGWQGRDMGIAPEFLAVLGPGEFLLRLYQSRQEPYIDYFLAYFPSQRTGDTIHSPKNCLPGAGWAPVQSDRIEVNSPGHNPFVANRYVIAQGEQRQLVLYWYWAHNRAVAGEYAAKFYLVTDS